ncbi:cupin domain-containing protein [Luteolibacter pohnpeiensis]|uniref:Cupin domain-containing protein n=1 Tax=Luteolibacter pohnpeiensis TaxID=454153 RepID=A0A934SBP9_9BACT|nr:cupin domain-containing protein [Luteolibacter pohnpeiensis]MBK1883227.1 cupin domain-containing protein [Luteolibacter pohnpeiensis]
MHAIDLPKMKSDFRILETRRHSQTAVMRLEPGGVSSKRPSVHPDSEQTLFIIEGELVAEIEDHPIIIRRNESLIIPAGSRHRILNYSEESAVAFTVYSPPAYPVG